MIVDKNNIDHLLKRILNNSYNIDELKSFIHLCTSISAAYIEKELFFKRIYFPIIYQNNNELFDIAVDLIAPIFASDKNGDFYKLKKYFNTIEKWRNNSLSELKKLVISSTKQELIEQFKVNDPAGYRVLRNIKLASKRNANVKTFIIRDHTYFYYNRKQTHVPEDLNPNFPEISTEKLIEFSGQSSLQFKTMPKIVENILLKICDDSFICDFVKAKSLFRCLNEVTIGKTITIRDEIADLASPRKANDYDAESFIRQLKEYINHQINIIYVKTNKIDKNQRMYYLSILSEYFSDLIIVNNVNRLPYYLYNSDISISKEDKHRIEYLIKLGKEHMRQELFPKIRKMKV